MAVKMIFCYAHEDEPLLKRLKKHLSPLQKEGLIWLWYDRDISAGDEWIKEIDKHLNTAQIILLLISPDFMHSDYCYSIELKRAMERHERGEARVIPIILRPASWHGILGKLMALPKDGKPVQSGYWRSIDEALFDITQGIRSSIETLSNQIEALPKISMPDKKDETLLGRYNIGAFSPATKRFTPKEAKPLIDIEVGTTSPLSPPTTSSNPSLCIKQENGLWHVHEIKSSLSLGRLPENDIILNDTFVSRQHAIIYVDTDSYYILKDVGSSNGTIVNGKLLRKNDRYILKDQDTIQLGLTIMVFNSV